MREILFRGKRVDNGCWAEGYYAVKGKDTDLEKHFIVSSTFDSNTDAYPFYFTDNQIEPETVCQYTGLKDKNGRKIFEGDTVKVRFKEAKIGAKEDFYNYIVKYDERKAEFGLFGNEELYGIPIFEEYNQPIMEVVGNIFDNPELCK